MKLDNYDLFAFGCSNTFGQGLPDCFKPPNKAGKEHSNFAWPQRLKDKVGFRQCINLGTPGISNKEITKKIIEYTNYSQNAIVVILWTSFARKTIFSDRDGIYLRLLPRYSEEQSLDKVKLYYGFYHEDFDACFDNFIQISLVHHFLKNKNITSYHIYDKRDNTKDNEYFDNHLLDGVNIKAYNWYEDFHIDDALDKPYPHPGVNSHKLLAENIKEWFFD